MSMSYEVTAIAPLETYNRIFHPEPGQKPIFTGEGVNPQNIVPDYVDLYTDTQEVLFGYYREDQGFSEMIQDAIPRLESEGHALKCYIADETGDLETYATQNAYEAIQAGVERSLTVVGTTAEPVQILSQNEWHAEYSHFAYGTPQNMEQRAARAAHISREQRAAYETGAEFTPPENYQHRNATAAPRISGEATEPAQDVIKGALEAAYPSPETSQTEPGPAATPTRPADQPQPQPGLGR